MYITKHSLIKFLTQITINTRIFVISGSMHNPLFKFQPNLQLLAPRFAIDSEFDRVRFKNNCTHKIFIQVKSKIYVPFRTLVGRYVVIFSETVEIGCVHRTTYRLDNWRWQSVSFQAVPVEALEPPETIIMGVVVISE